MSRVITIRLQEAQAERLTRLARRLGYSQGQAGARLIEEALRMSEFALVDFRDSPVGRQAYIQGSSLAVWEVIMLLRERGDNVVATATYLGWPVLRVQAATNYAEAYVDEIDAAIADNAAQTETVLRRMLPQMQVIGVDMTETDPEATDDAASVAR
jgi:hypothetical protein